MKVFYILSVLLLCTTASYSQETSGNLIKQDWICVGDQNGDSVFVKSQYESRADEGIKNWVKAIKKSNKIKGVVYNNVTTTMLSIFDCENKRFKIIQIVSYDSTGKTIDSAIREEYEQLWQDAVPGSAAEVMLKKICELHKDSN